MRGKLRVKRKERKLLFYSNIIEDYPWLYRLLENNKYGITEKQVNSFPSDQKNFFDNMLNPILEKAKDEWIGKIDYPEDVLEENKEHCSLCNQPIKDVYIIINRENKKSLKVGSTCVTYFGIEVEGLGKVNNARLRKERIRFSRLVKLNKKFPGIKDLIDGWDSLLNKYPIMIPLHL